MEGHSRLFQKKGVLASIVCRAKDGIKMEFVSGRGKVTLNRVTA